MTGELVSIIIPAYNAAAYLRDAIESCLAQTHPHYEIIVVNDGSTDETADILGEYSTVRAIHQPNGGLAAARNRGIAAARGAYLQFLDADDLLLPTKLAASLAVFREAPDVGVVLTAYDVRTPDLARTSTVNPPPLNTSSTVLKTFIYNTTTTFRVPCPLIRTEHVTAVGCFEYGMQGVEDWQLWVKLAAHGVVFRAIPQKLVWYRATPGSMSQDVLLMQRSRLAAYQSLRRLALPREIDVERLIAARHHQLGVTLWQRGEKRAARQQFRAAWRTHRAHRLARYFLWGLSYVFSFAYAERILSWCVGGLKVAKRAR